MKLKLSDISNTIFFVCLTLVLSLSVVHYSVKADDLVTVSYEVTYHQSEARQMLSLINAFRTGGTWYWNADNVTKTTIAAGERAPLQLDPELEKIAMKRAAEIALLFHSSHTRPNGEGCYTAGDFVGENAAYGQRSQNEAFIAWCEDSEDYSGQGHRRNMLQKGYSHVGIGCAEVNGRKYWVQNFGNKSSGQVMGMADDSRKIVSVDVKRDFIMDTPLIVETNETYPYDSLLMLRDKEQTVKLKSGDIIKIKRMIPYIKLIYEQPPIPLTGVNVKGKSVAIDIVELDTEGNIVAKTEGKGQIIYEANYPMGVSEKRLNVEVERIDISKDEGVEIEIDTLSYGRYTGKPIEPVLKIEYTDDLYNVVELKEGKDYKLEFKNNINASTEKNEAIAIITGINGYKGKKELSFLIPPADADEFKISEISNQKYTGKAICPKVNIKNDEGIVLAEGKDYSLSYEDNIETGTATVHVEYKGNYSGANDVYFLILEKEKTSAKNDNNKKIKHDKEGDKKEENKDKDKSSSTTKNSVKSEEKIKLPNEATNSQTENISKPSTVINKIVGNIKYQLISSNGKVLLSLKPKNGVIYKIQYSTDKNMKKSAIINLKKAKTLSDKFKKGKTYYIKVGEFKKGKIKWGKIKKLIIK